MSPEPFDSRAKAPPAKRWEKGYGDKNEETHEKKWPREILATRGTLAFRYQDLARPLFFFL